MTSIPESFTELLQRENSNVRRRFRCPPPSCLRTRRGPDDQGRTWGIDEYTSDSLLDCPRRWRYSLPRSPLSPEGPSPPFLYSSPLCVSIRRGLSYRSPSSSRTCGGRNSHLWKSRTPSARRGQGNYGFSRRWTWTGNFFLFGLVGISK